MLRKIWIVLGAVALVSVAYVTAFAVEEVQQPVVADDTSGGAAEANTWTVCSSGCDFSSIQAAVDAASDGDTIELGAETFNEGVVITQDLIIAGRGNDITRISGLMSFGICYDEVTESPCTLERLGVLCVHCNAPCKSGRGEVTGVTAGEIVQICGGDLTIKDSLILDGVRLLEGYYAPSSPRNVEITRTAIGGDGLSLVGSRANVRISESQIQRANATSGFGVYVSGYSGPPLGGEVVIENTTISGHGGAVLDGQHVSIRDSTFVGVSGGGLYAYGGLGRYNTLDASNSIITGVTDDCGFGAVPPDVATTRSLFNQDGCGGTSVDDITNTEPLLLPLADNGGPTPTFALDAGSPAIDAGGVDCLPTDQRGATRPQDGDGDGVAKCDIGAYELERPVTMVGMDIKPDGYPNSINPGSRGVIPVAILGSDTFDVVAIDETTLSFGPGEAHIAHRHAHFEDVNLDGIMDLVTHYRTQDTGIACGDESATLTGESLDEQPIEGSDSVNTIGCRETRRPAIWMKDQDRPHTERRDGPVNIERK